MTEGCQYLREAFSSVLQRPTVAVKDVQVVSVNLDELNLKIKLLVKNPNSFKLEFSNLHYTILFNDFQVAEGTYKDRMEFAPEDNMSLDIPLTLSTSEALKVLRDAFRKQSNIDVAVQGWVNFHSGVGALRVEFSHRKDLFSL